MEKKISILTLCVVFICSITYAETITLNSGDIPIALAIKSVPIAVEQYSNLEDQIRFLAGYREGYKFALIHREKPNYTISLDKNEPYGRGYFLGEEHGFKDIKNLTWGCSIIDFDYTPVELVGKFRFGFEQSEFISSDGKVYWFDGNKDVMKRIPRNINVRATGYLSQEGMYGHMSSYPREFIVRGVKTIDGAENKNTSSPVPK